VGVAWGATQWHRRQHVAETTIHFEKVLPGCGLGSDKDQPKSEELPRAERATPWKHFFLVIINPVNLVIAVPVSQKKPS
jgi:hypothetical protein